MKNFIYKILDLLMLGRGMAVTISGVRLRLPTRYFRYYPSDYEKDSIRFFKEQVKPGQTVLDIGAQLGLMSKIFSDLVQDNGKVYSFEPTPGTFKLLEETIRINGLEKNVVAIQQAVAEKKGTAAFLISDYPADSANTLSPTSRQGHISQVEVVVVSIDAFKAEHRIKKIDFIKIDAEGAELAVLQGATHTLQNDRPIMNLAMHPKALVDFGSTSQEIYTFIQSHRYTVLYQGTEMKEADFIHHKNLFDVQLIPA